MPQALRDMPRLDERQNYFYKLYMRISGSRPPSMGGISAVPLSEIRGLLDELQIRNADWRELLIDRIQHLDTQHQKFLLEKTKKK